MSTKLTRILVTAGAGVVLAALVGWALLAGLYNYGLSVVPEPSKPEHTAPLSPLVAAALWARFEGGKSAELEPMTAWSFLRLRVCRVALPWFKPEDGREVCLRQHSGVSLASGMARQHVQTQSGLSAWARDLGHAATTAWVTRHWQAEEALEALAEDARWQEGWKGVDEAAQKLFGKSTRELDAAAAALLAATLEDEENHSPAASPWCAPDDALAARNRVLERMMENGAVGPDELPQLLASPLGVITHPCSP